MTRRASGTSVSRNWMIHAATVRAAGVRTRAMQRQRCVHGEAAGGDRRGDRTTDVGRDGLARVGRRKSLAPTVWKHAPVTARNTRGTALDADVVDGDPDVHSAAPAVRLAVRAILMPRNVYQTLGRLEDRVVEGPRHGAEDGGRDPRTRRPAPQSRGALARVCWHGSPRGWRVGQLHLLGPGHWCRPRASSVNRAKRPSRRHASSSTPAADTTEPGTVMKPSDQNWRRALRARPNTSTPTCGGERSAVRVRRGCPPQA